MRMKISITIIMKVTKVIVMNDDDKMMKIIIMTKIMKNIIMTKNTIVIIRTNED